MTDWCLCFVHSLLFVFQHDVFAALMEFLYTDQVAALTAPSVDAGTIRKLLDTF